MPNMNQFNTPDALTQWTLITTLWSMVPFLSLLYRWGNRHTPTVSNLSKTRGPVRGRVRAWTTHGTACRRASQHLEVKPSSKQPPNVFGTQPALLTYSFVVRLLEARTSCPPAGVATTSHSRCRVICPSYAELWGNTRRPTFQESDRQKGPFARGSHGFTRKSWTHRIAPERPSTLTPIARRIEG